MSEMNYKDHAAKEIINQYTLLQKSLKEGHLEFSTNELKEIAKRGNLNEMILPVVYANRLFEQGSILEADLIRSTFYSEQMSQVYNSTRSCVNVHMANLMNTDSWGFYKTPLAEVVPINHIRTEVTVHPFLSSNKNGICLITSENGKVLYINPQLFYEPLARPLLNCHEPKTNKHFVDLYIKLLVNTFGEKVVYTSRPWLKEGRLTRN